VSEQCFTSPPTQYRLYGRRFLQVKGPNQQYGAGDGPESRQVPSSTAQDRGACRPTTIVPCGEHACTPNMNRGSMSVSYRDEESDVVIVVHDSESETGSISPEASPENRQGSVSVAQDPAVCRPSVGVQREDPVCRPVSVSLRRLDMPLDHEQRCRVSVNCQPEENVSSGVSVSRGSWAPAGAAVVPTETGEPSGFACSMCSRTFRTYSGREQHTWRKHYGGRPRTAVSGSSPPVNRRSSGTSVCEGRGSQASETAAANPTAPGDPRYLRAVRVRVPSVLRPGESSTCGVSTAAGTPGRMGQAVSFLATVARTTQLEHFVALSVVTAAQLWWNLWTTQRQDMCVARAGEPSVPIRG